MNQQEPKLPDTPVERLIALHQEFQESFEQEYGTENDDTQLNSDALIALYQYFLDMKRTVGELSTENERITKGLGLVEAEEDYDSWLERSAKLGARLAHRFNLTHSEAADLLVQRAEDNEEFGDLVYGYFVAISMPDSTYELLRETAKVDIQFLLEEEIKRQVESE